MSPHDSFPSDDLDALLTPTPTLPNATLQQAILCQTTGVVRRRRHVRHLVQVAALVLCYVAGAASMQLWERGPAAQSMASVEPASVPTTEPAGPTVPKHDPEVVQTTPSTKAANPEPPLSPYERLRRYSDQLLEQKGDIPRAARYYALALKKATAEERAISSDDSWLLMAVKQDRMQERSDVHHGS